jgi:hypothetical protein
MIRFESVPKRGPKNDTRLCAEEFHHQATGSRAALDQYEFAW